MQSLVFDYITKILYESFSAVSAQDLKRKVAFYTKQTDDVEFEKALSELKSSGIIEIYEEQIGTIKDRIVRLTARAVKQSSSGSL